MDDFVTLVDNYWVDLIEQVVPSTTIWGSTIKYSNTIFDKDKFKYKRYSLITCRTPNNIQYPSPISGYTSDVEVIISDLNVPEYVGVKCLVPSNDITICSGVTIQQVNHGSEFIGSVNIIGDKQNPTDTTGEDPIIIVETDCKLTINEIIKNYDKDDASNFTPIYAGGTAPYTYSWSIPIQEGQFSDWGLVNGVNNEETATMSGTSINDFNIVSGDTICMTLQIEDTNGCAISLTQCFPK